MRYHVKIDDNFVCRTVDATHSLCVEDADRRASMICLSVAQDHAEAIAVAVNAASAGLSVIVETDNFGKDYPDESFVLYPMTRQAAEAIASAINASTHAYHSRYWKVEAVGYRLQRGFEP